MPRWPIALHLAALTLALPGLAAAGWRAQGGATAGELAQSVYLGAELPLTGDADRGLVQRIRLGWQSYGYDADGTAIDVRAPDAAYALGYRSDGDAGRWAAYAGLRYRDVEQRPARPKSEAGEEPLQLGLRFEGELRLAPGWRAGGDLTTYPSSKGYIAHGRVLREIGGGLALGPELGMEGDRDYSARQLGVVVDGLKPTPNLDMAAKTGIQRDDEGELGWFVGLEFSRRF